MCPKEAVQARTSSTCTASPLQEVVPPWLTTKWLCWWPTVSEKTFKANSREEECGTITELESCLLSIKKWMDEMRLKMNPSKTEFIYFGNAVQLWKCAISAIDAAGDLILRTDTIRYLGVWLDSTLNFKTHVTKKCKSSNGKLSPKSEVSITCSPRRQVQRFSTKPMCITSGLL